MNHSNNPPAKPATAATRAIGAGLIALLTCASTVLHAQTTAPAAAQPAASAADQSALSDGEITRWDRRTLRITLRHGEIKNLGMPPMTMVFKVQNAGLLDGLTVGDKVRFHAEPAGGGTLVTHIEKAR